MEALKSEQEATKLEPEALESKHDAHGCVKDAFPGENRALLA